MIRYYDRQLGRHVTIHRDPSYHAKDAMLIGGMLFCLKCKRPMRLRKNSRNGSLFFGCTGYPNCKATHASDPHGVPVDSVHVDATRFVKDVPK